MKRSKRPTYSPEFRLETAQLVVDQNYSQEEAAKAMSVAPSTISKWVSQLKQERKEIQVKQLPMTPEQIEIRDLKKRIARAELEKEILKKATTLLVSDSMNNSR